MVDGTGMGSLSPNKRMRWNEEYLQYIVTPMLDSQSIYSLIDPMIPNVKKEILIGMIMAI